MKYLMLTAMLGLMALIVTTGSRGQSSSDVAFTLEQIEHDVHDIDAIAHDMKNSIESIQKNTDAMQNNTEIIQKNAEAIQKNNAQ